MPKAIRTSSYPLLLICILTGNPILHLLIFLFFCFFPIYFRGKGVRNIFEWEIKGAILFEKVKVDNIVTHKYVLKWKATRDLDLFHIGNRLKYLKLWYLKAAVLILLRGDFTMISQWFDSVLLNFILKSGWFY